VRSRERAAHDRAVLKRAWLAKKPLWSIPTASDLASPQTAPKRPKGMPARSRMKYDRDATFHGCCVSRCASFDAVWQSRPANLEYTDAEQLIMHEHTDGFWAGRKVVRLARQKKRPRVVEPTPVARAYELALGCATRSATAVRRAIRAVAELFGYDHMPAIERAGLALMIACEAGSEAGDPDDDSDEQDEEPVGQFRLSLRALVIE
jgi:hypothetical protein